ncbi:MAG TPA: serine protease [Geminicoccaceae bacterium]|nr:serine protease [Geminicoccaceae bacterium]
MVGRLIGLSLAIILSACASGPPNVELLNRSTVLVEHAKGHGTGTIVGPHAVLTAYHVVQESPLEVTFFAGPREPGKVVWQNAILDLALVEVEVPDGYPAPEWSCADLHAGQHLVSVGHPTQSRWVAVGGYLPDAATFGDIGLVSLGFPIGLGTSGGPVFDSDGRVVGVTLAILAERSSASALYDHYQDTGIGLMLPATAFCNAFVPG